MCGLGVIVMLGVGGDIEVGVVDEDVVDVGVDDCIEFVELVVLV